MEVSRLWLWVLGFFPCDIGCVMYSVTIPINILSQITFFVKVHKFHRTGSEQAIAEYKCSKT